MNEIGARTIHMIPKNIGSIRLYGKVDIADPGMDRGTYHQLDVVPGEYYCKAFVEEEKPNDPVWICQIVRKEDFGSGKTSVHAMAKAENWEKVSTVKVYTGLGGFFDNKPNYSCEEWRNVCKELNKSEENAHLFRYRLGGGFCTSTGNGDGEYPVYAIKKRGKIVALEIRFYEGGLSHESV